MAYRVLQLNPQLIYVRLDNKPTPQDDNDYLAVINGIMETSTRKLYFLLDFRDGMSTSVATIRRLAKITAHPNFGESTTIASSYVQAVYTDLFAQMRQSSLDNALHIDPAKAIQYLESLQAGLTQHIDWEAVLSD